VTQLNITVLPLKEKKTDKLSTLGTVMKSLKETDEQILLALAKKAHE